MSNENIGKFDWKFLFAMIVILACGVWFNKEIDQLTLTLKRLEIELDGKNDLVVSRLRTLGVSVRELEEKCAAEKSNNPERSLKDIFDAIETSVLNGFKKAPPEYPANGPYGKIKMETLHAKIKISPSVKYQTEDGTNWTVEMLLQPDGSYKCGKREK